MLRYVLILMLSLLGTAAFANREDDAELYMLHFIHEKHWDRAHRASQYNVERLYREPFRTRNITVLDPKRFNEMMPEIAADESVARLKTHIAQFIIDSYGAEHLSEIADFFRTPTGEQMLAIAKKHNLFARLHSQSQGGGPIDRWRGFLSPLDLARFRSFANTEAGTFFVERTWLIRRSVYYQMYDRPNWPEPPLNRPYIVDIMKADGVLKFPNRVARQSLISEMSADFE